MHADVWNEIHVLTPRLRKTPIRQLSPSMTRFVFADWLSALLDYARSKDLPISNVPAEGIKHYTFPTSFDKLAPREENVLVTASFGHIIPNSFLARFPARKRLNVHPSLLPRYRGAAPIQWTIANGDKETGVSVQRLVEKGKGIDGGDIVGSVDSIVSDLLSQLSSESELHSLLRATRHIELLWMVWQR